MIDLKFLRENPEIVKQNIRNKFQEHKLPLVDEVIELDEKARAAKQEADALRANRNTVSQADRRTHERGEKGRGYGAQGAGGEGCRAACQTGGFGEGAFGEGDRDHDEDSEYH